MKNVRTFRIDDSLLLLVKRIARDKNVSVSTLINIALKVYVKNYIKQKKSKV